MVVRAAASGEREQQLTKQRSTHVPVPVMGYGATTVLAYAAAVSASVLMPHARRTRVRQGP